MKLDHNLLQRQELLKNNYIEQIKRISKIEHLKHFPDDPSIIINKKMQSFY